MRLQAQVVASPAMREVVERADRVAGSNASVLLLGETGTGKGWLARRIHARGARRSGPFVAVNCGALPESLWESELFGHERGAFTGAERARRGRFETADGGTLFLDEIGDTPAHLQVKLLRALEHREIQRLGGERTIPVDVRIVAATNRDLESEIEHGRFREDLWYRLAVVTLEVPPLRQRREDIEPLARTFLAAARAELAKQVGDLSAPTLRALASYDWPGNVRELANVMERAALLSEGPEIAPGDLPLRIAAAARAAGPASAAFPGAAAPGWLDRSLGQLRDEVVFTLEREYLAAQLARTGGRLAEAAERAGIDRRTLHRKMLQLGLDRVDFRRRRPRLVEPARRTEPARRRS
jgi:DNA-binding NtrC family response regulator